MLTRGGRESVQHPLPTGAATRALDCPTSRPGRCRSRHAGAPGWPWLRDPGLGGGVINRRPRRPSAPRPPHCQLQQTPDPGPRQARPLGRGSYPREEGAGRAARGRREAAPPGTDLGVGGGGWLSASPKLASPEIFPNLLSLHHSLPRVPVTGGRRGGRLCSPRRALALLGWRGRGGRVWGEDLEEPSTLVWECRPQLDTLRSPPAPEGGTWPRSCCEGLREEG